jgi:hypothetical protein
MTISAPTITIPALLRETGVRLTPRREQRSIPTAEWRRPVSNEDRRVRCERPALDEAALSAVSRWQFTPTLVSGAPVAVLMTVTVNFTLQTAR